MFSLDKRGKELAPKPGLFQLEIQKKKKKEGWNNLEEFGGTLHRLQNYYCKETW